MQNNGDDDIISGSKQDEVVVKAEETDVENLALRIESVRANRIPIAFSVRLRFVTTCLEEYCADRPNKSIITLDELYDFQRQVKSEVLAQEHDWLCKPWRFLGQRILGFHNQAQLLLKVLDRAVIRVTQETKSQELDYQDFIFYFTVDESPWPFLRNPFVVSIGQVVFYYVMTPVIFCAAMKDQGVCPIEMEAQHGWYGPGVNALYFASATLSTVGYGDVSVYQGVDTPGWRLLIGIIFMIVSMIVLFTAFAQAFDKIDDYSPLDYAQDRILAWLQRRRKTGKAKLLHDQVRRIVWLKLSVVIVQFGILNLFGMFVARGFVNAPENTDPLARWDWMTTFYWSIQTTTTVGYGDLTMPFEMRWFQVFYLVISTYFVGDALGRLGSLNGEIQALKREYVWQHREVSKGMLEDMQAEDHDDKIDQYEFLVASLLDLEKISLRDVQPIMERFKQLAGGDPNGVISVKETMQMLEERQVELSEPFELSPAAKQEKQMRSHEQFYDANGEWDEPEQCWDSTAMFVKE